MSEHLLAFKSSAAALSVYEALPHRPIVFHVSAELSMGDACLAFFESSSSSNQTPFIVEVLNAKQPNAHLSHFDLLAYFSIARSSLLPGSGLAGSQVLDWTVATFLETKGVPERIVLDILTNQGEASMLQAMKLLLACPPEQKHLPVFTWTESKLRAIFGYVTLPQILAAILVNNPQQADLFFSTVTVDQGSVPDVLIEANSSIAEAADLMVSLHRAWLPVTDEGGRLVGVLTSSHILHAISKVLGTDGDLSREFSSPVREAMTPVSPAAGFAAAEEFPMTLKNLLRKVLSNKFNFLIVTDAGSKPAGVFSIEDVFRISLNQI